MSAPIVVGLSAVIVAADAESAYVLATRHGDGETGLPHGLFDPIGHRTFELGLRDWVHAQTGFEPGYVEQLYTFGDRGRELPRADLSEAPADARHISVGYLGLTPEKPDTTGFDAIWRSWYDYFPWEDHRNGRPAMIDKTIAPLLRTWADGETGADRRRLNRVRLAFGLDGAPWVEERTLERYELLYECAMAPEAQRDEIAEPAYELPASVSGAPMLSDHRRILATAMGRLRGKIKYRPVVFELAPERFTLFQLQQMIESILGARLHKQNFRRALDKSGLVEGTGQFETSTGGRPAEYYRYRRAQHSAGGPLGVATPRK